MRKSLTNPSNISQLSGFASRPSARYTRCRWHAYVRGKMMLARVAACVLRPYDHAEIIGTVIVEHHCACYSGYHRREKRDVGWRKECGFVAHLTAFIYKLLHATSSNDWHRVRRPIAAVAAAVTATGTVAAITTSCYYILLATTILLLLPLLLYSTYPNKEHPQPFLRWTAVTSSPSSMWLVFSWRGRGGRRSPIIVTHLDYICSLVCESTTYSLKGCADCLTRGYRDV